MTITENQAQEFLTETLFQYFTKAHFESNQGIAISDDEWYRFVDDCGTYFADACGEIATDIWEQNKDDYEHTKN